MTDSNQIFNIRVVPRARLNKIVDDGCGNLRVYTTAAPTDGAANAAVVKLLSEYWDVPKTRIKILRGATSRTKVIQICN